MTGEREAAGLIAEWFPDAASSFESELTRRADLFA